MKGRGGEDIINATTIDGYIYSWRKQMEAKVDGNDGCENLQFKKK